MGVYTTLHCANILCSIVCHAIKFIYSSVQTMVVITSWMGGEGGLRGETLFLLISCTKQCLGEYELTCPGTCPALSLPGVLVVLWVAHLVRADPQGLAI